MATETKNNLTKEKHSRYIDDDTEIIPDNYLFYHNEIGFFPTNNISVTKGQAKNGKTFLCSIFACVAVSSKWFGEITTQEAFKILYIDTEQSESKTAEIRKRIKEMCGSDYEKKHLIMCNMNGVDNMLDEFKNVIEDNKDAKLVILDGVVDLCDDFNDLRKSKELINTIRALASDYNIHINCIIHENPGTDKARGHLGTMLEQKCTETIQLTKSDADPTNPYFTAKFTKYRDKYISDFGFVIEELRGVAMPTPINPRVLKETEDNEKKAKKENPERIEKYNEIKDAFKDNQFLRHTDIENYLVAQGLAKDSNAQNYVEKAKKLKVIVKEEKGKNYYLNKDIESLIKVT